MKLTKEKTEHGINIFLEEEDRTLAITFGGNLDLYWTLRTRDESTPKTFTITKENYGIYRLFLELFSDIEIINIHDLDDEFIPFYIETEEEEREYLEQRRKEIEKEKEIYRRYNKAHYNELFNPEERKITWYSDETASKVANYVEIKEDDETFTLDFRQQKDIEGYDKDFKSAFYTPIRFRNSGSSYDPFNIVFMRMYNEMQNVDDVLDAGHQLHMEEYLYEQQLKLVKERKINDD